MRAGVEDRAIWPPIRFNFARAPALGSGLFDQDRIRIAVARATRLQRRSLVDYYSHVAGALPLR